MIKNKHKRNLMMMSETYIRQTKALQTQAKPSHQQREMESEAFVVFVESFLTELESNFELFTPNPFLRITLELLKRHFSAKPTSPSTLVIASGVPYATGTRRLQDMIRSNLIEQRPRTKTGKSYTLHPTEKLLAQWQQISRRVMRDIENHFGEVEITPSTADFFYGGSYLKARAILPLQALAEPIKLSGGVRALVHGDPTFMVMSNLKRQFEQVIGCEIKQRAFSIDRLYDEATNNAKRKQSQYDIIAIDLPWVGEFAEKKRLMPLDEIMDIARLDPTDFHPAGWQAAFWGGHCYGVPAQTTPELLYYRKDWFEKAGFDAPTTTNELLEAARYFHNPRQKQYGIAWNGARGTALGHTFLMTMADFGQPMIDMPKIAGGYDMTNIHNGNHRIMIDTKAGLRAAEFLMELIKYSPPDILSMSWYERIKPYADGQVAMAYGYTLMAPYFELNNNSPAYGNTGFLPHPSAKALPHIAPVGGYLLGIPANIAPERVQGAIEALVLFTSPEAQKLYIQNGSRTNPRYSVGDDPEVREISDIFEVIDTMSRRDELHSWPRPPLVNINDIIQILGTEIHDMLRGIIPPKDALKRAQYRIEMSIN